MPSIFNRIGDWFFLGLFGIAWGFTFPLSKIAVSTGYQPSGLIVWQLVVSAFFLGVITIARRLPVSFDPRTMAFYLGVIMIGTLLPAMFSYTAFANLPAGIVALAIATVPMFSLVIALAIKIETFQATRFFGISLGVVALMLISVPEASLPDPEKAVFVLVALVAPLCYGMEGNYLAKFTPHGSHPIANLFMASVVGLLIAVPVALWRGEFIDLTANFGRPDAAILASGLFHAAAYVGYMWLVGRAGPVFTSQIAYFVTLWAVFISWLLLDEQHSAYVWIALALMLVALKLVQPKKNDAPVQVEF